jgi:hypothetical protein
MASFFTNLLLGTTDDTEKKIEPAAVPTPPAPKKTLGLGKPKANPTYTGTAADLGPRAPAAPTGVTPVGSTTPVAGAEGLPMPGNLETRAALPGNQVTRSEMYGAAPAEQWKSSIPAVRASIASFKKFQADAAASGSGPLSNSAAIQAWYAKATPEQKESDPFAKFLSDASRSHTNPNYHSRGISKHYADAVEHLTRGFESDDTDATLAVQHALEVSKLDPKRDIARSLPYLKGYQAKLEEYRLGKEHEGKTRFQVEQEKEKATLDNAGSLIARTFSGKVLKDLEAGSDGGKRTGIAATYKFLSPRLSPKTDNPEAGPAAFSASHSGKYLTKEINDFLRGSNVYNTDAGKEFLQKVKDGTATETDAEAFAGRFKIQEFIKSRVLPSDVSGKEAEFEKALAEFEVAAQAGDVKKAREILGKHGSPAFMEFATGELGKDASDFALHPERKSSAAFTGMGYQEERAAFPATRVGTNTWGDFNGRSHLLGGLFSGLNLSEEQAYRLAQSAGINDDTERVKFAAGALESNRAYDAVKALDDRFANAPVDLEGTKQRDTSRSQITNMVNSALARLERMGLSDDEVSLRSRFIKESLSEAAVAEASGVASGSKKLTLGTFHPFATKEGVSYDPQDVNENLKSGVFDFWNPVRNIRVGPETQLQVSMMFKHAFDNSDYRAELTKNLKSFVTGNETGSSIAIPQEQFNQRFRNAARSLWRQANENPEYARQIERTLGLTSWSNPSADAEFETQLAQALLGQGQSGKAKFMSAGNFLMGGNTSAINAGDLGGSNASRTPNTSAAAVRNIEAEKRSTQAVTQFRETQIAKPIDDAINKSLDIEKAAKALGASPAGATLVDDADKKTKLIEDAMSGIDKVLKQNSSYLVPDKVAGVDSIDQDGNLTEAGQAYLSDLRNKFKVYATTLINSSGENINRDGLRTALFNNSSLPIYNVNLPKAGNQKDSFGGELEAARRALNISGDFFGGTVTNTKTTRVLDPDATDIDRNLTEAGRDALGDIREGVGDGTTRSQKDVVVKKTLAPHDEVNQEHLDRLTLGSYRYTQQADEIKSQIAFNEDRQTKLEQGVKKYEDLLSKPDLTPDRRKIIVGAMQRAQDELLRLDFALKSENGLETKLQSLEGLVDSFNSQVRNLTDFNKPHAQGGPMTEDDYAIRPAEDEGVLRAREKYSQYQQNFGKLNDAQKLEYARLVQFLYTRKALPVDPLPDTEGSRKSAHTTLAFDTFSNSIASRKYQKSEKAAAPRFGLTVVKNGRSQTVVNPNITVKYGVDSINGRAGYIVEERIEKPGGGFKTIAKQRFHHPGDVPIPTLEANNAIIQKAPKNNGAAMPSVFLESDNIDDLRKIKLEAELALKKGTEATVGPDGKTRVDASSLGNDKGESLRRTIELADKQIAFLMEAKPNSPAERAMKELRTNAWMYESPRGGVSETGAAGEIDPRSIINANDSEEVVSAKLANMRFFGFKKWNKEVGGREQLKKDIAEERGYIGKPGKGLASLIKQYKNLSAIDPAKINAAQKDRLNFVIAKIKQDAPTNYDGASLKELKAIDEFKDIEKLDARIKEIETGQTERLTKLYKQLGETQAVPEPNKDNFKSWTAGEVAGTWTYQPNAQYKNLGPQNIIAAREKIEKKTQAELAKEQAASLAARRKSVANGGFGPNGKLKPEGLERYVQKMWKASNEGRTMNMSLYFKNPKNITGSDDNQAIKWTPELFKKHIWAFLPQSVQYKSGLIEDVTGVNPEPAFATKQRTDQNGRPIPGDFATVPRYPDLDSPEVKLFGPVDIPGLGTVDLGNPENTRPKWWTTSYGKLAPTTRREVDNAVAVASRFQPASKPVRAGYKAVGNFVPGESIAVIRDADVALKKLMGEVYSRKLTPEQHNTLLTNAASDILGISRTYLALQMGDVRGINAQLVASRRGEKVTLTADKHVSEIDRTPLNKSEQALHDVIKKWKPEISFSGSGDKYWSLSKSQLRHGVYLSKADAKKMTVEVLGAMETVSDSQKKAFVDAAAAIPFDAGDKNVDWVYKFGSFLELVKKADAKLSERTAPLPPRDEMAKPKPTGSVFVNPHVDDLLAEVRKTLSSAPSEMGNKQGLIQNASFRRGTSKIVGIELPTGQIINVNAPEFERYVTAIQKDPTLGANVNFMRQAGIRIFQIGKAATPWATSAPLTVTEEFDEANTRRVPAGVELSGGKYNLSKMMGLESENGPWTGSVKVQSTTGRHVIKLTKSAQGRTAATALFAAFMYPILDTVGKAFSERDARKGNYYKTQLNTTPYAPAYKGK